MVILRKSTWRFGVACWPSRIFHGTSFLLERIIDRKTVVILIWVISRHFLTKWKNWEIGGSGWLWMSVHPWCRDCLVLGLADLIFSPCRPEASAAAVLCWILRHLSLIPLFVFIGAGGTGATLSCAWHCSIQMSVWIGRITQNPGTNDLRDQYKFHSLNADYSKLIKEVQTSKWNVSP